MTFVPRDFSSITLDMVNWLAGNPDLADGVLPSDLVPGSLERAHLEAVAVSIEEHEVRTAQALAQAIPQACYAAFGFSLLPPVKARVSVLFTALVPPASDLTVPAGAALISTSGTRFVTLADATIPAVAAVSAAVMAEALEAGPAGNIPAATLTRMVVPVAGVDLVTNPDPAVGGANEETEEARAVRFQAFVSTLVRGTAEALEYAALSTGMVLSAKTVDPCQLTPTPDGVPYAGLVWLFVDDGIGGLSVQPDVATAVLRTVNGYIANDGSQVPGWKVAGVRVNLMSVQRVPLRVQGAVKLVPGGSARWDDIQAALTATAQAYFGSLGAGATCSYQRLSSILQAADPDVAEVDLYLWRVVDGAPSFTAPPVAADIAPYSVGSVVTLGWRCALDTATWVLA